MGNSFKATSQLRDEHQGVLLMLQILEKIAHKLTSGKEIDPGHLVKISEFLQVFVDRCHHSKEEDLLFKALEKTGMDNASGPVAAMLSDHDLGRKFAKGLRDAIADYSRGNTEAKQEIIHNARDYIRLLREHIDKEDNILYPLADSTLPQDLQSELYEQFEQIEKEKIGLGKHEEFHKLIDTLKQTYL